MTSRQIPLSVDFDRHRMKRPRGKNDAQTIADTQTITDSTFSCSAERRVAGYSMGSRNLDSRERRSAQGSEIVSVTTSNDERCPSADMCAILEDEEFAVQVRVVDRNGDPTTVSRDTTIVLEKLSGEGSLVPDGSEETITRGGSEATFGAPPDGLTYDQSGNPTLRVRVTSGVQLNSDQITVHIAVTAVGRMAPEDGTLDLDDPNCGDGNGVPNSVEPTCGHLLTASAAGAVVMSVGSCEGLGRDNTNPCRTVGETTALLVTLYAIIKQSQDDPHSTMILACDKDLCGQTRRSEAARLRHPAEHRSVERQGGASVQREGRT